MKRNEERAKHYQTFEDLEVYQVAREFRKAMYRVAKQLPGEEKFGLTSQIRRAALSLTNNISADSPRMRETTSDEFTDNKLSAVLSNPFNSSSLQPFNE